jgi:hypothetical protein
MSLKRGGRRAKARKTKGPFKSAISGLFISRRAAARWPHSSYSIAGRRKKM